MLVASSDIFGEFANFHSYVSPIFCVLEMSLAGDFLSQPKQGLH